MLVESIIKIPKERRIEEIEKESSFWNNVDTAYVKLNDVGI